MKEKRYLIDSNIIIYHLNNDKIATEFLVENIDYCAISIITYIEVLSFDFQRVQSKNIAKTLLECFEMIEVGKDIASQSIGNRKIKKIKLPDNVIASTAQVNNLILVTRNTKDFKLLDIELLDPFDI